MQQHECVYVSVLEEYNRPRKAGPGHIMHIMNIMHIMHTTHILMGFVSQFSLGGLISILNHLQAQETSTSVVCHSSQLHTGTSSSCSSGWERDNTQWHAKRITRLKFLELLVTKVRTVAMDVSGGTWTAGPLDGGSSNNGNNNERHWNETCTQNTQNMTKIELYA